MGVPDTSKTPLFGSSDPTCQLWTTPQIRVMARPWTRVKKGVFLVDFHQKVVKTWRGFVDAISRTQVFEFWNVFFYFIIIYLSGGLNDPLRGGQIVHAVWQPGVFRNDPSRQG